MLTLFLLLGNLGASIGEVAIVVEAGKQLYSPSQSGQLKSFAWMSASLGGILGNILGGIAIDELSPKTMFLIFVVLLVLQFFMTITVSESSLNLPKKMNRSSKFSSISKQISELHVAILRSAVSIALFMISDVLFVKGIYRDIRIADSIYVVIISGLQESLFQFKILPFSVLMAQICPSGCEGSVMAFSMSAVALATIISGYLGVALAMSIGVSGADFSGFSVGILIQAACTVLPLCWISWIPDGSRPVKKEK
ncbi:hypothetical protein BHM03_00053623 [Ensete ventricosum]|nr:hypothetical protein BHM03_00053623 [Ensete ventricosum]